MFKFLFTSLFAVQAFPTVLMGIHWRLVLDLGNIRKYHDAYSGSQELSQSLVPAFKAVEQGLNELHDRLDSNSNYDTLARVIITGIFFMLVILNLISRFHLIRKFRKTQPQPSVPIPPPMPNQYPGWVNKI